MKTQLNAAVRANAAPRVRAITQPIPVEMPARSWIHDRAPRLRDAEQRHRRERAWAWLSVVTLIICWDATARLDQRVSPPRVRIAHAVDREEIDQKALMPVSSRPTVSW
jgi:hypothetical protein